MRGARTRRSEEKNLIGHRGTEDTERNGDKARKLQKEAKKLICHRGTENTERNGDRGSAFQRDRLRQRL